jgi:glutathione synthase
MSYKLALISDPIDSLNPDTDSSIAMLTAAAKRGWQLYYIQAQHLSLVNNKVTARASLISLTNDKRLWYAIESTQDIALESMDVVLMRQDPPVNQEYIYNTHLLSRLDNVVIANDPQSLRSCNEKLFALEFADLCPPTLVSSQRAQIKEFYQQHLEIVLKPINGLAGRSIFKLSATDANFAVIVEEITQNGKKAIIAQKFIPQISAGDKRILIIDGKPLAKALLRKPQGADIRANLAVGGVGEAVDLSTRDKFICQQLAPVLKHKGLLFVGIDVIGDYLTEINVTSPTGIVQIAQQTGINAADELIKVIEQRLA